jgi:Anti-sigma-K factor rskA, C-terminal/Putative zinc-finger
VRLRREAPHTLAGAYALDSLTEPDRLRFKAHLAECDVCRLEAASLREAAIRLAAPAAEAPPADLRERLLATVAITRQQPPVIADAAAGFGRRASRLVAPRMAVAIAGGCMLVALVLGGMLLSSQNRLSQDQMRSREVAAVLNAPDAKIITARAFTGGSATVVMSHRDRALVLTTAMLPALPAGQHYQVWLMGHARPRSAGMLPGPHRGMTAPVVVTGVRPGDMVGVTAEPGNGTASPTSTPVLMLVLPA